MQAVKQFSKRQLLAKKFVRRVDRRIQKDTMLDFVKREIAIMKNLNHPNVMRLVEALDTGEDALYLSKQIRVTLIHVAVF